MESTLCWTKKVAECCLETLTDILKRDGAGFRGNPRVCRVLSGRRLGDWMTLPFPAGSAVNRGGTCVSENGWSSMRQLISSICRKL
jgi:hypothetical protein